MGRETRAKLLVLAAASFSLFASGFCALSPRRGIQLGTSINLLSNYGFLALNIRALPYNDSSDWLIRKTTKEVLDKTSFIVVDDSNENGSFDHHFHVEFCDDAAELLQAYFRNFTIEGVEKPWRAFTSGWRKSLLARRFGVDFQYFSDHYSYILVRLYKQDSGEHIQGLPSATWEFEDAISKTKAEDKRDMMQLLHRFGTHYISEYEVGDIIYQVFVYAPKVFREIRDRVQAVGIGNVSPLELYNFFSPWYTSQIGKIQVASGNERVNRWVQRKLRVNYYIKTYPSVFRVHGDYMMLDELESMLGGEAVVGLTLRSVAVVFKDPEKNSWCKELLENTLRMWEVNM